MRLAPLPAALRVVLGPPVIGREPAEVIPRFVPHQQVVNSISIVVGQSPLVLPQVLDGSDRGQRVNQLRSGPVASRVSGQLVMADQYTRLTIHPRQRHVLLARPQLSGRQKDRKLLRRRTGVLEQIDPVVRLVGTADHEIEVAVSVIVPRHREGIQSHPEINHQTEVVMLDPAELHITRCGVRDGDQAARPQSPNADKTSHDNISEFGIWMRSVILQKQRGRSEKTGPEAAVDLDPDRMTKNSQCSIAVIRPISDFTTSSQAPAEERGIFVRISAQATYPQRDQSAYHPNGVHLTSP